MMKNFEQLVEEGARNVLANSGVSEAEAPRSLENYFAACEEVLRRLLQGELDKLASALRGQAAALRDEGKAIAAKESIFARGEHAGWISKEIDFAMGAPARRIAHRILFRPREDLDRPRIRSCHPSHFKPAAIVDK